MLVQLKQLQLSGCSTFSDLSQVSNLSQLEFLGLNDTSIGSVALEALHHFPNLMELSLQNCKNITDACLDHLLTGTRLVNLYVEGTSLSWEAVLLLKKFIHKNRKHV